MGQSDRFDALYAEQTGLEDVPIRLDDEVLQADKFPPLDLWEEDCFVMVGESEEHDLFLWTTVYSLKGHGQGVWMVKDGAEQETLFMAIPKERRNTGLHDHDFARTGWHPGRRGQGSDLKVERHADKVVWRLGDREYISAPPVFQVRGSHGGVDVDITYRQAAPAFWEWGAFATAAERDRAGYDAMCRVEGTIKAGGETYVIKKATGIKERITVGQSSNPIRTLPPPRAMYWLFTMAEETGIFLFHPGPPGLDLGTVVHEGRHLLYKPRLGHGEVTLIELEHWRDPRSGLHFPSRWRLNMSSTEGVVDLDINSHGRCWFNWVLSEGVRMCAYLLATANGSFTRPDGTTVAFKDELICVNWLRTYSTWYETLPEG
jgi:hypothetical protein